MHRITDCFWVHMESDIPDETIVLLYTYLYPHTNTHIHRLPSGANPGTFPKRVACRPPGLVITMAHYICAKDIASRGVNITIMPLRPT